MLKSKQYMGFGLKAFVAVILLVFTFTINGRASVTAQDATPVPEATSETTGSGEMMMASPNEEMQAVLDQLMAFEAPPLPEVAPRIARVLPTAADAVVAVLAARGEGYIPEAVADVTHRLIPGAGEDLLVRIYTPEGGIGPFPVVVYFHGGGWVIANINVYDGSARAIANAAGAIVVSVAYRQAPEYPFLIAAEDAYAATQWVMQNAVEINGDPARVAVAGESAGGNLAAVTTLMARDRGGLMPVYQLLVYPITQVTNFETPSYIENANAVPLGRAGMTWFVGHYVAIEAERANPYVSPLLADDLSGLPPATIITAQIDPLRSDGEDYANRLTDAGVAVVYQNYDAVTHEFFGMGAVLAEARDAVALAGAGLRSAFGN